MTRATLETLAIVAYRQPITRPEIEDIRGVESGAVVKHLLDKRLVRILGRKDEPGRPLLYGTTKDFLSFFSLKDLGSLPTLRDFAELSEEHRATLGLEATRTLDNQADGTSAAAGSLQADLGDSYAPVGDDEIVQELAEALDDLRRKDRRLREVLPQPELPAEAVGAASGQDETNGKASPGAADPSPGVSGSDESGSTGDGTGA
jgi:segregation and condensation protein B